MVDKNALVVNLYLILKLQSEEGRSAWMERPVVGSQGVDRRMEVIVMIHNTESLSRPWVVRSPRQRILVRT